MNGCKNEAWSLSACEEHTKMEWKNIERKAFERMFRGLKTYASRDNLEGRKIRVMYILNQYQEKIKKELGLNDL